MNGKLPLRDDKWATTWQRLIDKHVNNGLTVRRFRVGGTPA